MKRSTQLRLQALLAVAVSLVAAMVLTMDSGDTTVRVAGRLGPTPGPNSLGHVQGKRAYLERTAGDAPDRPAAALVSFSKFVSAPEAEAALTGMRTTVVFVRLPQAEPDALHLTKPLDTTVAAAVEELADLVRAEIISIEAQLRDAQEPDKEALERSLAERRQALGNLRPDCACVYAAAVQRTTLGALARLQQRPEVLLVDVPEPVMPSLEGWELTPILPQ